MIGMLLFLCILMNEQVMRYRTVRRAIGRVPGMTTVSITSNVTVTVTVTVTSTLEHHVSCLRSTCTHATTRPDGKKHAEQSGSHTHTASAAHTHAISHAIRFMVRRMDVCVHSSNLRTLFWRTFLGFNTNYSLIVIMTNSCSSCSLFRYNMREKYSFTKGLKPIGNRQQGCMYIYICIYLHSRSYLQDLAAIQRHT